MTSPTARTHHAAALCRRSEQRRVMLTVPSTARKMPTCPVDLRVHADAGTRYARAEIDVAVARDGAERISGGWGPTQDVRRGASHSPPGITGRAGRPSRLVHKMFTEGRAIAAHQLSQLPGRIDLTAIEPPNDRKAMHRRDRRDLDRYLRTRCPRPRTPRIECRSPQR